MVEISNSKILITGSEGFIGSKLSKQLREIGAEVKGIDIKKGINILNWDELKTLERVDLIYHLAAITFIPYAFKHPRETYNINVLGSLNILEYCRLNDIKKIIFSSTFVYGQPQYFPIDEAHPVAPNNPYSRSKLLAENLCRGYSQDYGLNCIVLRQFNIYGPGQQENFLIPSILKQIQENNKIELRDPDPKRDLLYISDLISAYLKSAEYEKSKFEVFNIGYGKSNSVQEIVDQIIKLTKREIKVNYTGERRPNEIMDTVACITKAHHKLNWQPKIDLIKGLKLILKS